MKKVRQIIVIAIFCLVGCAFFSPGQQVQAATKKVTKVSITGVVNSKRTMVKGKTLTLKASVAPTNATYKKLKWTSSNTSVATVNQNGKVTAKKNGTTVITATARDGSKKKASVTITVGTMVSKVSITTAANKKIYVGKGFTLATSVAPAKASNKALVYTSSNKNIAAVSSKGYVKAVGVPSGKSSATATITVKSADGSGKSASYKVTVLRPVTSISAKSSKIVATPGTSVTASLSASPSTAYDKKLRFASSNTKVATVNASGTITTHALGTAKITAASTDGTAVSKSITVDVVKTVTKIVVPTTTQKLVVGETYQISPSVTPMEIADYGVSYTSSNTSILTVTSKGVVTAHKAGNANIYVKTKDPVGTSVTVKFNVKNYADITYKQTQFVAHMGSNSQAPSNSIPAYKIAGQSKKFMGIECDVRETKDGQFVLIHDENISSRTNGSGVVSSLTLAQIQNATMNKGNNLSKYPGLTIPTLKDYLYLCKTYGMKPVLHIKSITHFDKLVDLLNEVGIKNDTIITGGLTYMKKFKAIDSKLNIYWLCYLTDSNIATSASLGIDMNVDYAGKAENYADVTQVKIEKAHAKGIKVGAWTVNNMNTAKKLLNKGIDFITTDMYSDIKL